MLKSVSNSMSYYEDNETYLMDMLQLLDLTLLRIFAVEEEKNQGENPWKGLVISPDEIHRLLFDEAKKNKSTDSLKLDKLIQQKWEQIIKRKENSSPDLLINQLLNRFELDEYGSFLLILGMANTLDSKYERIFGYLNDNVAQKHPTFDIMAKALELNTVEKMGLRKKILGTWNPYRLIVKWDENDCNPFFSKEIKIYERIFQFLMGIDSFDIQEHKYYKVLSNENHISQMVIHKKLYDNIFQSVMGCEDGVFLLTGDKGVGKKHLIQNIGAELKRNVLIMDASVFITEDITLTELLRLVRIETQLAPCFVVLDHIERLIDDGNNHYVYLRKWMSEFSIAKQPLFLVAHEDVNITKVSDVPVLKYNFKSPDYDERLRLWTYFMNLIELKDIDIQDLSEKFKFTPFQIRNTIKQYDLLVRNEIETSIYEVAKEQIHHKLNESATRVKPVFSWSHLVLPKEQEFVLHSICSHVEKKHMVYNQWGFENTMPYGSGTAVIFAGPPGTGKTMAAQVLSNDLNLDLYKIDLSKMVSKYIGETEKNLHKVFKEASISNAILFFDEADALFGKRSDVKEAKDRYANIEVAYLLQKIEEYDGVTILATNYLNNIDKAFLRRIRFIVDFPFPDVSAREKIWRLSIPDTVPISSDIDFEYLARTFELSGGNIKNVVINSAFFAANQNKYLSMRDIIKSAGYELQKMDKLLLRKDLKEFGYLMD